MAKKIPAHGIKHIRIEPADDGGFMTEIVHHPKPKKPEKVNMAGGKIQVALPSPAVPDYEDNITKHVHSNGKDLGDFISKLFPPPVSRSKTNEANSQAGDGSRIDTYDGSGGGDTDEQEEYE